MASFGWSRLGTSQGRLAVSAIPRAASRRPWTAPVWARPRDVWQDAVHGMTFGVPKLLPSHIRRPIQGRPGDDFRRP
jgi:hypothetical protein